MKNTSIIILAAASLAASACTGNHVTSSNNLNSNAVEYGSPDTYKDTIEMGGRVYSLQQGRPANNDNFYGQAQQYAFYSPAPEQSLPYGAGTYVASNLSYNTLSAGKTTSDATETYVSNSYLWY